MKISSRAILPFVIIFVCCTGCASYTIQTAHLVDQLRKNQQIGPNERLQQFSLIDYPSNNLDRIKCRDKHGNEVWLYPDKNTEFIVTTKSSGKKVKAYFDTVIFQGDTLYGLRSRLAGGLRKIPVDDIDKITIRAEFPGTERASK